MGFLGNQLKKLVNLAPEVKARLSLNLLITAAAEDGDIRVITWQVQDADGNNVADTFILRVWISSAGTGEKTGTNTSVIDAGVGNTIETVVDKLDYLAKTDANGQLDLAVENAGDVIKYAGGYVEGRFAITGQLHWTA